MSMIIPVLFLINFLNPFIPSRWMVTGLLWLFIVINTFSFTWLYFDSCVCTETKYGKYFSLGYPVVGVIIIGILLFTRNSLYSTPIPTIKKPKDALEPVKME